MLFSVTAAAIWLGYGSNREKTLLATGVAIFRLAVIGFGEWWLHSDQNNVTWVSVGLLVSDSPENLSQGRRIYAPANPPPLVYEKMLPPFESRFTVGKS